MGRAYLPGRVDTSTRQRPWVEGSGGWGRGRPWRVGVFSNIPDGRGVTVDNSRRLLGQSGV